VLQATPLSKDKTIPRSEDASDVARCLNGRSARCISLMLEFVDRRVDTFWWLGMQCSSLVTGSVDRGRGIIVSVVECELSSRYEWW
jgi:hypothetical protein